MLLAELNIKDKLVLIFQEGMNKKNIKKTSAKKLFFYITIHTWPEVAYIQLHA